MLASGIHFDGIHKYCPKFNITTNQQLAMTSTVSISQQYLLASKARAKLMKCAATDHNKDYNLRVLVGHANLLDKVMESVDAYSVESMRRSVSKSGSKSSSHAKVDYFGGEEAEDEDYYSSSSSDSESDDDDDDAEVSSSGSDYDDEEDVYEYEAGQPPRYSPLNLLKPQQPAMPMVTVTIDQCLEDKDYDDAFNSDTDSDLEDSATSIEQDLSMMPLTLQSKDEKLHFLPRSLDNHEFNEVTPIQV